MNFADFAPVGLALWKALWPVALLTVAAFLLVLLLSKKKQTPPPPLEKPVFKPLLTRREQGMFAVLVEALPEYAILAQISFGALLNAKTRAARNRFDRKIADFAICNKKTAEVLALIELDDSSHRGKEAQDAARDDMLNRAGYTVLRYARVPSAAEVRADMKKVLAHLKRQRR